MGVLAALLHRAQTGEGQIVDAAIVDGVTSLMSFFAGLFPSGAISLEPGQNWIGGGAPFYRCYRCADVRDSAVGAVEQQSYRQLLELIGETATQLEIQTEHERGTEDSETLAGLYAGRGREAWGTNVH